MPDSNRSSTSSTACRSDQRTVHIVDDDDLVRGALTGLLRSIDGRITGVHSRSDATPFKRSGFSAEWSGFDGLEHYSDWQFVAEQAFTESAGGVQTHAGPGDTP